MHLLSNVSMKRSFGSARILANNYFLSLVQFLFFSLIRPSGFRLLILFTLLKIFPLGKITSRGRPEDVPKKHPDVIRTSPYGPICHTKGGICSGKSLGRTQDINLTIIHQMSF